MNTYTILQGKQTVFDKKVIQLIVENNKYYEASWPDSLTFKIKHNLVTKSTFFMSQNTSLVKIFKLNQNSLNTTFKKIKIERKNEERSPKREYSRSEL